MALLEPSELESLERLAIATRSRLLGFFSGDHRSKRFGSSLDFADYREYKPGDDFRRIDAALSARLDRLFLKLFEAEEDVPVRIVVDASASMGFGGKLEQASRIAAAFAHVALVQSDRVRLYAAREGGAEVSRWFRAKADGHAAMGWLGSLRANGSTGLRQTVRGIREEGRAGMVIVIGDLLEPDWEEAVRRLSPPGEAAVVHVLSGDELEPAFEGDLTLVDAETGREVEVTASAEMVDAYRARLASFLDGVRSACTSRGIAYALARSDDDVMDLFMRTFRREQVVR